MIIFHLLDDEVFGDVLVDVAASAKKNAMGLFSL
jgi:hypothetical protein